MDEFELIKTFFQPLTKTNDAAQNLENDTAIYSPPEGFDLVLNKDCLIEGVHYLKDTAPEKVAKKLLRVNLSDLAASGARPVGYLLGIMAPKELDAAWVEGFAKGLAEDQDAFDISLFGGDTTAGAETLSLSLTALGIVPKGQPLTRTSAKPGDDIYLSGEVGGAFLGLQALKGKGPENQDWIARHEVPTPRLELGQKLLGLASAAIDISDGLVADLGHLTKASKQGAEIHLPKIPMADPDQWEAMLTGGDDFELLFTAPSGKEAAIQNISKDLDLPLTKIGKITEKSGVFVLDENQVTLPIKKVGYRHFGDEG